MVSCDQRGFTRGSNADDCVDSPFDENVTRTLCVNVSNDHKPDGARTDTLNFTFISRGRGRVHLKIKETYARATPRVAFDMTRGRRSLLATPCIITLCVRLIIV